MSAQNAASELVLFITRGIVSEPDSVRVQVVEDGTVVEIETSDEDRGRVIGRQGRVAKAMRAVLAASRSGRGMRLEIND